MVKRAWGASTLEEWQTGVQAVPRDNALLSRILEVAMEVRPPTEDARNVFKAALNWFIDDKGEKLC